MNNRKVTLNLIIGAVLKRIILWSLWLVLVTSGGIVQNDLAQENKDSKHPQSNNDNQGRRKDKASENNQQDDSVIFRVKVRGWDPQKKEEIVGEAEVLKSVKRRATETDPAPFPVRGKVEIYIEIAQLSIEPVCSYVRRFSARLTGSRKSESSLRLS